MWPEWWDWELEFSSHVEMRMVDRDFTEIELRVMYDRARNYRRDYVSGRWIIETNAVAKIGKLLLNRILPSKKL